jgi:hypothetical protein
VWSGACCAAALVFLATVCCVFYFLLFWIQYTIWWLVFSPMLSGFFFPSKYSLCLECVGFNKIIAVQKKNDSMKLCHLLKLLLLSMCQLSISKY